MEWNGLGLHNTLCLDTPELPSPSHPITSYPRFHTSGNVTRYQPLDADSRELPPKLSRPPFAFLEQHVNPHTNPTSISSMNSHTPTFVPQLRSLDIHRLSHFPSPSIHLSPTNHQPPTINHQPSP